MNDRDVGGHAAESNGETTSVRPTGSLSIPGRNGGRLRNGGTNRGGPGAPPSALRGVARGNLEPLIPKLSRIARAKATKDSDKIRAIDVLARIGLGGHTVSVVDLRLRLKQQTEEIFALLPREQADALVAALREIWRTL